MRWGGRSQAASESAKAPAEARQATPAMPRLEAGARDGGELGWSGKGRRGGRQAFAGPVIQQPPRTRVPR